jgi:hypothetical protein
MERQGDIIIFDETEQASFSVPAVTTPADAIEIADGFRAAALAIQAHVGEERLDNPRERKTENDLRQRQARAIELLRMSHLISAHCAPEIAEQMARELNAGSE